MTKLSDAWHAYEKASRRLSIATIEISRGRIPRDDDGLTRMDVTECALARDAALDALIAAESEAVADPIREALHIATQRYEAAEDECRRLRSEALAADAAKRRGAAGAFSEAAEELRRPFTQAEIRRLELSVDPRFEPFLIIEDRIRALAAKVAT